MHYHRLLICFSLLLLTNSYAQNPCGDMDLLAVNDTVICNDEDLIILANNGFENYSWNTDASTQGISVSFPGTYTVTSSFFTNNLVTNGDFSNGNNDFSSAYTYNSTSLWSEGTYSVTTNANNVHSGFTGTGSGNFLVVNGATNPGSQVWCQEITVTPNTLYNFSTIVNTVAGLGNPALLQFSINGNTIGTQFTAPSSFNTWEEFNATWNSGTNTSAEICIVNQNISGSGNDFGLDDITFTTLCTASESINVTFAAPANATISEVDVLCETGNQIVLNAVDQNGLWSGNGITNSSTGLFSPSTAGEGIHIITYTISTDCGATDTIHIEVLEELESEIISIAEICRNENPFTLTGIPGPGVWMGTGITDNNLGVFTPEEAETGENTITYTPSLFCAESSTHLIEVYDLVVPETILDYEICYGQSIELALGEGSFNSYLWSTSSLNSYILVNASGDYTLEYSDENLCEQEVTFTVLDKDSCELITMPNVFTPNNDLINDFFIPIEYEFVPYATIKVFNRWGTVLWNTDDLLKGWNGKHYEKDCVPGVYFWTIDYKTNKGIYRTLSGNVSLFRE